ncbi:LysR family transcriptional regulator [Intestinibacter sp.]
MIIHKTIVETGSFADAARKLNYTQSTITFQIHKLENELSFKLFEKVGRKMIVTQAGKEILPYIDSINQSVEQIKNHGLKTNELTGDLKIVLTETLLTYRIQPVIEEFRLQAPHVKLSILPLNCYEIQNNLLKGSTDIVIHYDSNEYNSNIYTEVLESFDTILVASQSLDESLCDFYTPHQMKPLCFITNDKRSILYRIFDNYTKEKDIEFDGIMELGSIESIKKSVISNLGIAFLPKYVIENELNNGLLKELKMDTKNKKINAIFAYHKNKWISPATQLFINILKSHFGAIK